MMNKDSEMSTDTYQENTLRFNNKPNYQVTSQDGKRHWISRSIAVVAVPLFIYPKEEIEIYVPLGRRSQAMPLYPGCWGIPCGFLDWNESADDAVRREVYEEIGLDLTEYTKIPSQPNLVVSEPNPDENETVSLRYIIPIIGDYLPALRASEEATEVQWANVLELPDLAFNHAEIVHWAISEAGISNHPMQSHD